MALDLKSYFANIPKKQVYIFLGVFGVALVAVYLYLLMWPLWGQKGKLEEDLQKLQTELNQKKAIAAAIPKLEAEIKALEKQLQMTLVRLPEEKEIPKLLTQVNTLGHENGLEFLLFRPGTPARKGFYAEVPMEIRVEGQYHSLGGFLDRISKLERIVNVADIRIAPLPPQQQQSGRTVIADFRATTYTFVEKGESAGAPTKK